MMFFRMRLGVFTRVFACFRNIYQTWAVHVGEVATLPLAPACRRFRAWNCTREKLARTPGSKFQHFGTDLVTYFTLW